MCKNTVDEQVIPSCGAILSHFRSEWRGRRSAAKTSVQKCGCSPLTCFTSVILLTFDLIFPLPPPHPSPASALVDNTPSIWRWRTTHTCTVKRLLSGKELSSISCGSSVLFFFVFMCERLSTFFSFFFFTSGRSFFTTSIEAGLRGQGGKDSCTRIGVWRFSCRAKANLTRTHMHANVKPTPELVRHAWGIRGGGGQLVFLFQKKHTYSDWMGEKKKRWRLTTKKREEEMEVVVK